MCTESEKEERIWGLSSFSLKCIAMATMLIDHVGMALFPQYIALRIVGRLAFPIYCFLLVEGAVFTSDLKKYLARLFIFALISEIPFDLVRTGQIFSPDAQNVFFTLFAGLLAVALLQKLKDGGRRILAGILIVLLLFAVEALNTDYGSGGVLFILIFYVFRERKAGKAIGFAVADLFCYGGILSVQAYAVFSLIPILCYNEKRGPKVKYIFYIFYPAHLLVLYWLKFRI